MNTVELNTDLIKEKLISHGLRVTHQRIVIYSLLYKSKNHPTADVIYSLLKSDYPSLSLATVYKTLDTFNQHGLIKKLKGNSDSAHYDADLDSHNHLICLKTNKIMDFEDNELVLLINSYLKNKNIDNFEIQEVQLNIIGETIK